MKNVAWFHYRGVEYKTTPAGQGDVYVERVDGKLIRGSEMCQGMIQIGISKQLERAAKLALRK